MSTLTKILIVLLTLSSIFLCGIVVTYVANAEDYKQKNRFLMTSLSAAKENERVPRTSWKREGTNTNASRLS